MLLGGGLRSPSAFLGIIIIIIILFNRPRGYSELYFEIKTSYAY